MRWRIEIVNCEVVLLTFFNSLVSATLWGLGGQATTVLASSSFSNKTSDGAWGDLLNFIEEAANKQMQLGSRAKRGPVLAKLLALGVSFQFSQPSPEQESEYTELLCEFASHFASKPSTFYDLQRFLQPCTSTQFEPWSMDPFACPIVTPFFLGTANTTPQFSWKLSSAAKDKVC